MKKKGLKLITEASYDVELIESKSKDIKYIVGIFSTADVMVANGRIYEKQLLEREVDKLQESIENRSCWGELGHPPTPDLNLDRIAILVTELKWQGNNLWGKAEIVEDAPCGKIAKALVEKGKIGISSRGLGTIDEESKKVNDDYKLLRWDLVGTPSNSASWVNGIYEGKTFSIDEINEESDINESVTEIMKKFNFMPTSAMIYCKENGLEEQYNEIKERYFI